MAIIKRYCHSAVPYITRTMKIRRTCLVGLGFLVFALPVAAKSKTNTSQKVPASRLQKAPYRFNGVILTESARGSGFCAKNKRIYFSAAHVVFGETEWVAPPKWYPGVHRESLRRKDGMRTRGYLHWNQYADLATSEDARTPSDFSRDVIVGYSFRKLIQGKPAPINLNGVGDLRRGSKVMITGYPAQDAYKELLISGYFLHRTRPERISFKNFAGDALQATLITTGPGNSGGPVWTKRRGRWQASGVLVGGLPSETIVYGFSSKMGKLIAAAENVVDGKNPGSLYGTGVSGSSVFFETKVNQKLPDGLHKWQRFKTSVKAFDVNGTATKVGLSLNIRTKHRGDLQVVLQSPDGQLALVHNEGGADKNHLVIQNMDLTEFFEDPPANGPWSVLVQDRLKGDIATFRSYRLELAGTVEESGSGDDGGGDLDP